MNLDQLQRAVFDVIRQPLTASERMRARTLDGRSTRKIANEIVKPNSRMTSVERLEIYNRVYWFRILSSLAEDFPGLREIIGQRRFDKVLLGYLTELPSESFTLRNLGSRLEAWLRKHRELMPKVERLALDMVRLEWADIEAFDGAEFPRMTEEDLRHLEQDPVLHLQPNVQLLDLAYPVDDLLIAIRRDADPESDIASNVVVMPNTRHARHKRIPMPKPKKTYLAVHRQDDEVYFKQLKSDAFALLRAIREGKSLSAAIEASVNMTHKSPERIMEQLHDWFANWSSLGWFCQPPKEEPRL
jgi:hypothetical protein